MRAVPIDYQDDPRIPPPHQPPPPPPQGHYATPVVNLKGGYTLYAPDMLRVEQVYGTTTRRPHPNSAQYASPYGYIQNRLVLL